MIRFDAVDFGDCRIVGASEDGEPLACSGADVETYACGALLEEGEDGGGGVFAGARAEEGPEVVEPVVFEFGEGEEGGELEGEEELEDCWDDVIGGVS